MRRTLLIGCVCALAASLLWDALGWPEELAPAGAIKGAAASTIRLPHRPAAGADPWWTGYGAFAAADVTAAYRMVGAASIAEAVTDLSGNGNDLINSGADLVAGGLSCDRSTNDYIDTQIIPAGNQAGTIAVRFEATDTGTTGALFGVGRLADGTASLLRTLLNTGNGRWRISHLGPTVPSSEYAWQGILTIAGATAYSAGNVIYAGLPFDDPDPDQSMLLCAQRDTGGGAISYSTATFAAVVILKNTVLDASEVSALAAAMSGL